MAFQTGSERKAVLGAVAYNLLFRFDHSTFFKTQHDVTKLFFGQVVAQSAARRLMRPEYFSMDGAPIKALRFGGL